MAGYIGSGASVVSSGVENKKVFDITTNTTSLTGLNYTVGKVHVYHNGVRLVDGTDFTATNSTSIALTVAAVSGDQVVVVSYASFQLSEHYTKAETDTLIAGADSTPSIDDNGNATAITIDSSENVMLGTTNSNIGSSSTEEGIVLNSASTIAATRSGNVSAVFNRLASDGDIISLRKDGSTVGTIGVSASNNLAVGSTSGSHSGITFGTNTVAPMNVSNFTNADDSYDLGNTSARWQDLYLSGGVYLGGTGAANKLDDVETGTFTAGVTQGTIGGGDGVYVKIGDLVFCSFTAGNFSNTSSGNAIEFTGLPFTSNNVNHGSHGSVFCRYTNKFPSAVQVSSGAAQCRMWRSNSTAYDTVNYNNLTNGGYAYFFVHVTYRTA